MTTLMTALVQPAPVRRAEPVALLWETGDPLSHQLAYCDGVTARNDVAGSTGAVWLARTGEGGYVLADCIINGVVALRYRTVPDATQLSQGDIARYVDLAKTKTNVEVVAAMLVQFVHSARVGDLVITPHRASRQVYVGEVAGGYRFADPSPVPGFLHLRPVRWLGSVERDSLPAAYLKEIDRPPTFYQLDSQAFWQEWAALLERAGSAPRPPPHGASKR